MADTLFGMTPEDIQAQRQAAAQQQAMQYAKMAPAEQVNYGGYMAGSQLGAALGGMMGAKDPVLEKATMATKLMQETDMNDLDSVKALVGKLNKAGLSREAMSLIPRIDKLSEAEAVRQDRKDSREAKAEADTVKLSEQGRQRIAEIEARGAQAIQAALIQGATKTQIAELRAEVDREKMKAAAQSRIESQTGKAVPASTLKMYSEAKASEEKLGNSVVKADEFLSKLNEGKMVFGLAENIKSGARALAGTSNESDQNKAELTSYVQGVVNDILMAARGTQTADDAARAEKQVLTALSKNDTALVKNSLEWIKRLLVESKNIASTTRKDVEILGGIGDRTEASPQPAKPSQTATKKGTKYQILED